MNDKIKKYKINVLFISFIIFGLALVAVFGYCYFMFWKNFIIGYLIGAIFSLFAIWIYPDFCSKVFKTFENNESFKI